MVVRHSPITSRCAAQLCLRVAGPASGRWSRPRRAFTCSAASTRTCCRCRCWSCPRTGGSAARAARSVLSASRRVAGGIGMAVARCAGRWHRAERDPWPLGPLVRFYDEGGPTLDLRSGLIAARLPTLERTEDAACWPDFPCRRRWRSSMTHAISRRPLAGLRRHVHGQRARRRAGRGDRPHRGRGAARSSKHYLAWALRNEDAVGEADFDRPGAARSPRPHSAGISRAEIVVSGADDAASASPAFMAGASDGTRHCVVPTLGMRLSYQPGDPDRRAVTEAVQQALGKKTPQELSRELMPPRIWLDAVHVREQRSSAANVRRPAFPALRSGRRRCSARAAAARAEPGRSARQPTSALLAERLKPGEANLLLLGEAASARRPCWSKPSGSTAARSSGRASRDRRMTNEAGTTTASSAASSG